MEWFTGYTVAFAVLVAGILFIIALYKYLKSNKQESGGKVKATPIVISCLLVLVLFIVFYLKADRENNPYYNIYSGGKEIEEVTPTNVPAPSPTAVVTAMPSPTASPTAEPTATPSPTPLDTPAPGIMEITEYGVVDFELPATFVREERPGLVLYNSNNAIALTLIKKDVSYSLGWWDIYKSSLTDSSFVKIDEYDKQQGDTTIHYLECLFDVNDKTTVHCMVVAFFYDGSVYILNFGTPKNNYENAKSSFNMFVDSLKIVSSEKSNLKMVDEAINKLQLKVPDTWEKDTKDGYTYFYHQDGFLMTYNTEVKSITSNDIDAYWSSLIKPFKKLDDYEYIDEQDLIVSGAKAKYIKYNSSISGVKNCTGVVAFIYNDYLYSITMFSSIPSYSEYEQIFMDILDTVSMDN